MINELKFVLKQKIQTLFFIFYVVLGLVPIIVTTQNTDILYILFIIGINILAFIVFSIFALFLRGKSEKIYLSILYALSVIPNIIILSYALISDAHIRGEMYWVIFDSNISESTEYLRGFITPLVIVSICIYLIIGIILLYKSKSQICLPFRKYRILFGSACLVLAGIIFTEFGPRPIALIDFYKSGLSYYIESVKAKKYFEKRQNVSMNVNSDLDSKEKHTFIFIIGESLSRTHMELYGYARETNPQLKQMENELSIYKDVVTPETYTYPALKKVLTFANHEHPEYYYDKASIVSLFNAIPFETYWISNQESKKRLGRGQDMTAEEAKHVYWLCPLIQPDGIVIPQLEKILKNDTAQNKMIFIHLMGCHVLYHARYPSEFSYFNYKKQAIPHPQSFWKDKHRLTIDEYDNAVRYNDYVVSSIIKTVKEKKEESSFVIYFPDHGEEIYDSRDFKGHDIENTSTFQCEIPFIFWQSEKYKKEVPEIIIDVNRPYSTENFIHSLSTLARLNYADYDPKLSLFSSEFVPQDRNVGNLIYKKDK